MSPSLCVESLSPQQLKEELFRRPHLVSQWKPLMDASYHGRADLVALLVEEGADPDVVSKTVHRYRPLHRAIEARKTFPRGPGHVEVVRVLLSAGADPFARGSMQSLTPLALAAFSGEHRFIDLLRQATPVLDLYHASILGELDIVRSSLRQNPEGVDKADQNGWTPLIYCASSRLHETDSRLERRLLQVAELLLSSGASPHANWMWGDKYPIGPLYYATGHSNNPSLARLLLKAGANPNDGESLYHAAEFLHLECLEVLLDAGADVNFNDPPWGNTPLHFLLSMKRTKGVSWLLEQGADPNRRSGPNQETALHAAARVGVSEKVLQQLLKSGADPAAVDAEGNTALDLARQNGKKKAASFLALCVKKPNQT